MTTRFTLRAAVYLIIRQKDTVLLQQRAGSGFMDGWYGLPSGHVDGNETMTQAMIREAKEELNIDLTPDDLRVVLTIHRQSRDAEYIDIFFETSTYTGVIQNNEPHKCTDLSFLKPDETPQIVPYIQQALHAVAQGKIYTELGWGE